MQSRSLLLPGAILLVGLPVLWITFREITAQTPTPQEWVYIILTGGSCFIALQRPIWGLYLFPFALFVIPETYLGGIRFLSPPLLILAATLAASLVHTITTGQRLPMSKLIVLVGLLIGWHLLYFLAGFGPQAGLRMYTFAQGAIIVFVASWVIDSPKQATRVIYAWTLAWTILSVVLIIQFIRWLDLNSYTLATAARIPDSFATLTFANPNVNILAMTGGLFVPVALELSIAKQKLSTRLVWIAALVIIVTAILLTFSRAGIVGLFMSLGIWLVLRAPMRRSTGPKRLHSLAIVGVCAFVIWLVLSSVVPAASRLGEARGEISGRLSMAKVGYAVVEENPLLGTGADDGNPGTHSYIVKSAMEFGVFYLLLFSSLYLLLLYNGWRLYRAREVDPLISGISLGITVATIVALPQTFFAITFQTSMFTVVFWTLQVIQWTYWESLRRARVRESRTLYHRDIRSGEIGTSGPT